MLTNNSSKLSKNELTTAIKKSKSNTFEVFDIHNTQDLKEFRTIIEKSFKKGSLSIVLIEGGK